MARNVNELHPTLQQKVEQLKQICEKEGLKIGISECLRTAAEQDALYAQGRTAPGKIVTNAKGSSYRSQHQWGIAFDFYRNDGTGAYNESGQFFEKVGALGKSIGLGWGGDWTSLKDKPHLYLSDWGSTPAGLKTTYGTPEKFFTAWKKTQELPKEDLNTGSTPEEIVTQGTTPKNSTGEYNQICFILDVQIITGSKADGKAGSETLGNTITVSRTINENHSIVTPLERWLKALGYYSGIIEADTGKAPCFGSGMEAAVNRYQKEILNYQDADGEITKGKKMWKSLLGMSL